MSSAPSERADRNIALVKPAAHAGERAATAFQLLESMVWAFQGTTRSNWIISSAEENANVVVIHAVDCDERVAKWQQSGKAVLVIVTDPEPSVAHEYVLNFPFRATQVQEFLEAVDPPVTSSTGQHDLSAVMASWSTAAPNVDPWSFLEAVQMLREVQNADVWLAGKIGKTTVLWVKGDCSEYSADPTALQAIRTGELPLASVKLQTGLPPPAHRTPRSAAELVWFAGFHASPELAPWLKRTVHYKLARWPDFGLIRPSPLQIRATATLAKASLTLDEIAARAQISVEQAARMLNALSACKLLVAANAQAQSNSNRPAANIRAAVPEPAGGFKSFLRLVRRRLGLNESP